jgi:SPFH domain / Band 7 family
MTNPLDSFDIRTRFPEVRQWRRRAIVAGGLLVAAMIVLLMTWNAFFVYVPPKMHLVIVSKDGEPLNEGQVLAEKGQKGIQREVKGEGWHFVLPIVYETELEKNTEIPPGKVGVVTARGGKELPPGRFLAERGATPAEEERGIQREVLPPGMYRINQHGYDVEIVPATVVDPGYVGVMRRLLGSESKGRFAEEADQRGLLKEVLQPGLYYINPKEFEVIPAEVGIFQTTFFYDPDPKQSTAITFISKGGFPISMDCTVEWEILPQDMPQLEAEYGPRKAVERNVIDVQAHAIGRDKGIDYGVQNFLEGAKREEFQNDFTAELTRVCGQKHVTVRSAFIRNIVIPESYLKPIRDKQIAAETEITNKAKEATAQSEADVEREQKMIDQRATEVAAMTQFIVAGIDRETENIVTRTEAEITKLKADYQAQMAKLESQRIEVEGQAAAEVTRLKETAKSSLFPLKMKVFQDDNDAFLRYSLAEKLNPKLMLRLFHSGSGTLWTNMGEKSFNLFLPAAQAAESPSPAPPTATSPAKAK